MYYADTLRQFLETNCTCLSDAQINAIITLGQPRPNVDTSLNFSRLGKPKIPIEADGGTPIYVHNTVASDDNPLIKIELKDSMGNTILRQIKSKIPPRINE